MDYVEKVFIAYVFYAILLGFATIDLDLFTGSFHLLIFVISFTLSLLVAKQIDIMEK